MTHTGIRTLETLRVFLQGNGAATAEDLSAALHRSRPETYAIIRKAARAGLIRVVAHVHTSANPSRVWDLFFPDGESSWRRDQRFARGRFCPCRINHEESGGTPS
jgi:hypothetical protein